MFGVTPKFPSNARETGRLSGRAWELLSSFAIGDMAIPRLFCPMA
jgi:hypothetical protein